MMAMMPPTPVAAIPVAGEMTCTEVAATPSEVAAPPVATAPPAPLIHLPVVAAGPAVADGYDGGRRRAGRGREIGLQDRTGNRRRRQARHEAQGHQPRAEGRQERFHLTLQGVKAPRPEHPGKRPIDGTLRLNGG